MRRIEFIFGVVLSALAAVAAAYGLVLTWQAFGEMCPNKDVLHWDGNLRMALVLDRYQYFADGNFWETFVSHLRANTWPPLRPFIALLLFAAFGPSAIIDVALSLLFFAATFLALLYGSWRLSRSPLAAGACFFVVSSLLLHTRELNAYALAGMLETQGMFFLVVALISLFGLYRLQSEDLPLLQGANGPSPAAATASRQRGLVIGTAFGVVGLGLTKYPYAIMLFLAYATYEFIRDPQGWWSFATDLLKDHYRGWRRLLLVGFLLVVVGLLVAGKVGYLGVNTRLTKRLIYLVCLVIFVDFNFYAYRARAELVQRISLPVRVFYLAGILPTLTWILINPDRFSTVLGGQFWVGTAQIRRTLFETLPYLFQPAVTVLALLALGVLGLALALLHERATPTTGSGPTWWTRAVQRPEVAIFMVAWLQYMLQDLFNPNKQDRHVYHMLPALLLSSTILFQAALRMWRGRNTSLQWLRPVSGAALITIALVPMVTRAGLPTGGYTQSRYFCYTDTTHSIFEQARWVADQFDARRRTVVINAFHELPFSPNQRNQASEIDVLLRMRALAAGGRVYSDHRFRWKSWDSFERLLVVAPQCNLPSVGRRLSQRSAKVGAELTRLEERKDASGSVCLESFAIRPSAGKRKGL